MGTRDNPMDHEERLKQNLEVLGVDNLSSLTLNELFGGIENKFPPTLNISVKRLIHIYVAWLNDRLTVIDNSDDETFRKELQDWVQFLRKFPVDDRFLLSCFQSWASEHSKADPTSSRRLNFAGMALQEILELEGEENYSSSDHNIPSKPTESYIEYPQDSNSHQLGNENTQYAEPMEQESGGAVDDHYGSMHPERWGQSLGDDTVGDCHAGAMHPDRYRRALEDDEAEIEDEQPAEGVPSFLTGANHLVYLEMMKNARREKSEMDDLAGLRGSNPSTGEKVEAEGFSREENNEVLGATGSGVNRCDKAPAVRPPKKSGRPKKNRKSNGKYFCMRCKSQGHMIEDCPTNLDPGYDIAPAGKNYICVYCGKGGHYATVCRKNPLETSLHQRRLRAGIYRTTEANLDEGRRPRDPERHRGGDLTRGYDEDVDQNHKRGRDRDRDRDYDRDYGRGHHRDYDRDYDRDYGCDHRREHDRDHIRNYDRYDPSHSRGYDQDRGREHEKRDHEGHGRRDERRPRQRSRSQEHHRTGQDHKDNKVRRSLSPAAANRDKKKARDRPRIDRYRSDKRNSHNTSRRSRSPRGDRIKPSKVPRSPLRDLSNSERYPRGEHEAVSRVEDPERVKGKHQDNSLEGPTQYGQLHDGFLSQEPVSASGGRILGHIKLPGTLPCADDLEVGDKDVIMAESNDRMPFDGDPAWEVFNLPRDEFLVALDELIKDVANTIPPSDDMDIEQSEPVDTLQPIGDAQPAMKLTAASHGLLMATTAQQEKPGDKLGSAFEELTLSESNKFRREESAPIVFGVSVKPSDPESSYSAEVQDWMKTCSRMNVWVNKIPQRNRATDFMNFEPDIYESAKVPDSNAVELSEPDKSKSGSERGVQQIPDDSTKAERPGSGEQQDITMADDEIVKEAEVGVASSTEGLAKHEDVLFRQELEVEIMGAAEDHVTSENVIFREQEATTLTMPEDHIMAEDIIAPEPEHEILISTPAKNHEVPALTSPEDFEVVGNDSLISVATGDSSTTEIGDQLMEDVNMLVPDVTQDATQH